MRLAPAVRVVCIPSADIAFGEAARAVLELRASATTDDLERGLRRLYPGARVTRRLLSDEPVPVWYAYRDGRYGELPDAAWHRRPGVAWAAFDLAGRITAANRALEDLVGDGRSIVGRPLTDFMIPENVEVQARQFAAVLRGEVLHSIGRGRRADGSELVLEYVGRLVGDAVHGWYRAATVIEVAGPDA